MNSTKPHIEIEEFFKEIQRCVKSGRFIDLFFIICITGHGGGGWSSGGGGGGHGGGGGGKLNEPLLSQRLH